MSKAIVRIKTIAKKEVVEFARDWRTIVAIIIIPILMFPILFVLFPLLLESEASELDQMVVDIEIQGDNDAFLFEQFNKSTTNLYLSNASLSEDISLPGLDLDRVRNMEVDAILRLNYSEEIWYYSIIYMSTSESSMEANSRIQDALQLWERNPNRRNYFSIWNRCGNYTRSITL